MPLEKTPQPASMSDLYTELIELLGPEATDVYSRTYGGDLRRFREILTSLAVDARAHAQTLDRHGLPSGEWWDFYDRYMAAAEILPRFED